MVMVSIGSLIIFLLQILYICLHTGKISPGQGLVKFGIETKHPSPTTSTAEFKSKVVEILHKMKGLFIEAEELNQKARL
jgi:hypothetical protein